MIREKQPAPIDWGRWHLNSQTNELEFWDGRKVLYFIDLDNAKKGPAACLDWIFQVSQKTWMTNEDRGNLLLAIQDTIHPQAHLCSFAIAQAR